MTCVNCGKNEAPLVICDQCRQSYPGDPQVLEMMVHAFQLYRVPVLEASPAPSWPKKVDPQ